MKLHMLIEQIENKRRALKRLVDPTLLGLNTLYRKNGYELRIVGGAVRDILMDEDPKDIDLATDATPEESMSLLKSQDIKVIETGLQHGTVVAHINGEDYEITTLRIDKETDGRHATVEFTKDWEQDAERRDLTFNAMSMDFDGNLYDYFGGQDDLKSGRARFVGDADKRVQEDYLRILRYFRFQGRTDSPNFDDETLKKIKSNATGLDNISGERIWSEMNKILSGNHLGKIMIEMKKANVLKHIGLKSIDLKELVRVRAISDDPNLLLAAILSSPEEMDSLREKWKFSNPEANLMKFILKNREKQVSLQDAKRMHVMNRVDKNLILKLLEYQGNQRVYGEFEKWEAPIFPITGEDLKNAGIPPGPEMGRIINSLKNKWADSAYSLDKNSLLNSI